MNPTESLSHTRTEGQVGAVQRPEEIEKLLKELSQDVTSLALDRLVKKLTDKVRETLKVDVSDARIFVHGKWQLLGISGMDPKLLGSTDSGNGGARRRWIMEHRRPLLIPDITRQELPSGTTLKNLGLRGYLGVPFFSRTGEVIGTLRVLSYQPREFSHDEVAFLQQLAGRASIAIENARLFEEVQKKSEELEAAYRTKSDFFNAMVHELRTPLNVVMGIQQLLLDGFYGALSARQKAGLETMGKCADELLHLINELLGLARLQAKRVPLRIGEFAFKEVVDELQISFIPLLREKGLSLRFALRDTMPRMRSDKAKIQEILQNLLANAIKYTDRGEIELRVRTLQDSRLERERVEFSVRDTGIGIKKEEFPRIFEPFHMVDGVDRKKYPGTGLGLSIVKRLVELLEGEIRVESEWGQGSSFTVTLPRVHPVNR